MKTYRTPVYDRGTPSNARATLPGQRPPRMRSPGTAAGGSDATIVGAGVTRIVASIDHGDHFLVTVADDVEVPADWREVTPADVVEASSSTPASSPAEILEEPTAARSSKKRSSKKGA